ncbi:hypothetical protein H6G89_21130 [Oscillatoria sp. FACHB-1407]|uniref:hypothetical protein n=1 Tax=Oscillatoria sp. FACHB-1407 TaxID=2692847 RepID=UPI001684707D|nr:hypothetical protein [Oscillatoria sp. FACHB-1407]MBD2463511.1 hypothetical protein [Oscillatoria sp. FACHB-1407]
MATYSLGEIKNSVPPIVQQRTINPGTQLDTFEFLTSGGNINLSITNISGGGNVNLSLFHDANGNGSLDQNDTFLGSSGRNNQLDESLNINGSTLQGKFFARVSKQVVFGVGEIPVSYKFSASLNSFSDLLPEENTLGTISQDTTRSGAVGDLDTTDVYSFSVNQNDLIRIKLSKQGGNTRLRLIEDRNQNQQVDSSDRVIAGFNQIVARGRFNGPAINYLLQVQQVSGETNYQVTFDRSPFSTT